MNGDWYVVGPVTIQAIDPRPLYGAEIPRRELDHMDLERHEAQRVGKGFMLNPPAAMKVAYDSGVRNWFDPALIQKLPVTMNPGDSLVSTVSMPKGLVLHAQLRNNIERGVDDSSPIRTAAVLTCVSKRRPVGTMTTTGRDRGRPGTHSSTRCGHATAPRFRLPPTVGNNRTRIATTVRRLNRSVERDGDAGALAHAHKHGAGSIG